VAALLHFLWKGCVLGALVIVWGAILKRASAQTRYTLYVSALLLMAACVPSTFAVMSLPPSGVPAAQRSSPPSSRNAELLTTSLTRRAAIRARRTSDSIDRRQAERSSAQAVAHTSYGLPQRSALSSPLELVRPAAPLLTGVYCIGVAVMLLRLARGIWGGHRLRRSATIIEDKTLIALTAEQARRIGLRFTPLLGWCNRISVPVVVGIVKPMILLPATLASGLSADQLQVLLTHELAHVRRYDLLVNMSQQVIQALLFFHPVVWWVNRRISIERENCADDAVLAAGWQPRPSRLNLSRTRVFRGTWYSTPLVFVCP